VVFPRATGRKNIEQRKSIEINRAGVDAANRYRRERISHVVTLAKFTRNKSKLSFVIPAGTTENLMLHKAHDDQELCSKALAALHAEALPLTPPVEVWGGKGSGDPCPVCGDHLKPSELELELAFEPGERNSACVLHMHVRCFAAWEVAKKSVMRKCAE
jgi:hypothetical protein